METAQSPLAQRGPLAALGGGLSAGVIKWIAIVAMVTDHTTLAFLPDYFAFPALPLHMFGRITGPVMFYFIAEGYHYTRNKNRYTLRLAIFAAVAYVPFVWFRSGSLPNAANWMNLNVIYTLLMGHLALRARHEIKQGALRAVAVALCLILAIPGDWGWLAVLYILLFDYFRGRFARQAMAYSAVTLTLMLPYLATVVRGLLGGTALGMMGQQLAYIAYYAAYFLPLLLLCFYNGQRGHGGKYVFYIIYPAHLLVLALVQAMMAAGV